MGLGVECWGLEAMERFLRVWDLGLRTLPGLRRLRISDVGPRIQDS